MKGLLLALETQGDEVLIATSASFVPEVERTGLRAVAVGRDWTESDAARTMPGFLDGRAAGQLQAFARLGAEALPDLRAVARAFGPDVVVRETTEFAGWAVAEQLDVPTVICGIVVPLGGSWLRALAGAELDDLLAAAGLPPDPLLSRAAGELLIDLLPASFTPDWLEPPATRRQFRGEVPELAGKDDLDPLVYVTLGTVFNHQPEAFRIILTALADLPVRVLAATGRSLDPAVLGTLPPQMAARPWVDQQAVLAQASVVVNHGGCGTVVGSIAAGLPQVCLPFAADQPLNAALVAQLGIGRSLAERPLEGTPFHRTDLGTLRPETVRDAVAAMLADPAPARATAALRAELLTAPPVAEAALAVRGTTR